jgi:RimJ/RimL family protein N-acetyltransferase
VALVPGLDAKLFNLLGAVYRPFLAEEHADDMFAFLVTFLRTDGKDVIGYLTVGKGQHVQLALIPSATGQGFAEEALTALYQWYPFDSVGWTCHKDNLPSLRLLARMNGGIIKAEGDELTGRYWPGRMAPPEDRDRLTQAIAHAEPRYAVREILMTERRQEEREALARYVRDLN